MIRFLVNPSSGGGKGRRLLPRLRSLAAAAGAELVVSRDEQELRSQARLAVRQGVERLIVAGGDGTFHHALQGLAGTDCALGLVPLGRGNDLAQTLGVPPGLEESVERAVSGPIRPIDLGRVGDRYFAVYCGVGFDSEVARFVHEKKGLARGRAVYVYGVLRTLASFSPPVLEVEHDAGRFRGRAMFAVVSNCPCFGGGMRIAPSAEVVDGQLDLVILEEISRLELLRVFPKVYRGRHTDHPAVTIVRTARARLAVDREMAMFGDGEPLLRLGVEPVEVEVAPGALWVVVGNRRPRVAEPVGNPG